MLAQRSDLTLECVEEWTLKSATGKEYLVQIGFPRDWRHPDPDKPTIEEPVPIVYLSDGNSVFLSALEVLHRRLAIRELFMTTGVVVAIGYPVPAASPSLWSGRRSYDLTPPTPGCAETEGGADEFLDFLISRVRPHVHQRLKDTRNASPGREALYGHSYGGLLTLYTLFTRPEAFNCYIASSPSIWYQDRCILRTEEAFRKRTLDKRPSLMLFMGGQEERPPRRRGETEEKYEERLERYLKLRMITNMHEMHERLSESGQFEHLSKKVYEEEDHGTIIACTVSRGLATFFEDWPLAT
ncbi:IroE protein [Plectosphaerella cucumerina]|uniref:IroE protein n=1 Tax=Plectosphaerella cucumerina TaxID=40658 RepID=A0A8K0TLT4_9PEZI|nr:IroE protein [Plectosphaerella cucumerina]